MIAAVILSGCSNGGNVTRGSQEKLPILGVRKPVKKIVDGKTVIDTIYKTIPFFQLVNQDNRTVSNRDFDGTIHVADFFFTSCPDICPVIQRNMLSVYQRFKNNNRVKIASYTIDPDHDSVAKLKEYADKLGVEGAQWEFLRGDKKFVYALAKNDYMVSIDDSTKGPGGFAHEGYFVLVDKAGRMRGAYDGTDMKEVNKLIKDMEILLTEGQ
jgi:protein SCO1